MTWIEEFLADQQLETLFVIHPEPDGIGASALEAWVQRLNARLAVSPTTRDLQAFEAHPDSAFCIGGVHTRRSPYPSFQILRRSLLKGCPRFAPGLFLLRSLHARDARGGGLPRNSGNLYSVGAPYGRNERR
jgi:hypothetical protein